LTPPPPPATAIEGGWTSSRDTRCKSHVKEST